MDTSLFRKNSLERISTPEQLNQYVKITNPGVWCILIALLIIFLSVAVWSVFGSIPDTVSASGIIFPQNGVTAVIPRTGGRISDMRVKVGDFVQAGQIIAIIPQEDILKQILELKKSKNPDENQINSLVADYESRSIIISPVSGIILSARNTSETVSSTDAVASIVKQEKYADDRQVVCYIPTTAAKKLKEGMEVQVSPSFAPREEYGYIYGHLTSIGIYPVTEADVLAAVGSQQYAEGLLPPGSCVEVRITLTVDPESADKIKWSNKKGSNIPLTIGTNCNLLIVVSTLKPYQLIFN